MRKRNHLQVNTFPFLAVLLCAMGSLILVLLVMDRRSKLAAQARARAAMQKQADENSRKHASRVHEVEQKKQALQSEWNSKHQALTKRVDSEDKALSAELQAVQSRMALAAQRLREEEEKVEKLRNQVRREQEELQRQQANLDASRQHSEMLNEKLASADKVKAKLTADLEKLEQALRDLQSSRKKDGDTYSVVPYKGTLGTNRVPLYVECEEAGVKFHPDGKLLQGEDQTALKQEVQRRFAAQQAELNRAGVRQVAPYLMLMVRPDGIKRYYQIQAALRDLSVEFGYEFVDADWKLHFPATIPTSIISGQPSASPPPSGGAKTGLPPALPQPSGGMITGLPPMPTPGGNSPSLSGNSGAGRMESLPPITGTNTTPFSPKPNTGSGMIGSQGNPTPMFPSTGSGLTPLPGRSVDAPPINTGASSGASTPTQNGTSPPSGLVVPSLLPATTGGGRPEEGPQLGSSGSSGPAQGGTAGTESSAGSSGSAGSAGSSGESPGRQRPLRPAKIGGPGDFVVFIECQDESVVIHPLQTRVPAENLRHTLAHNKLYKYVEQMLTRRGYVGEKGKKVHIRFLIHEKGLRTFHLAYPVLESLPGAKTRYDLHPLDDVSRIVAGQ